MNMFLKLAIFVAVVSGVECGIVQNKKFKTSFQPFLTSLPLPKNSVLKSTSATCDEEVFSLCTQNYAKSFNMTKMPSDAKQFLAFIQQYVTSQGLPGFEFLCKATTELNDCLGDSADACLSVQNLVYIGVDQDDAMIYATMSAELRYECGPAYQIIVDNFDCATQDSITEIDQINYCISSFNASIYNNPVKICQELQTFDNCFQSVYTNCGADFDSVICGVLQAAYSVSLPKCAITCMDEKASKLKGKISLSLKQN